MSASGRTLSLRRLAVGALVLIWGAAGLLAGTGCEDSVDLCSPPVTAGAITGRIRSGGVPVDGYVIARFLDDDYDTHAEYLAAPDTSGFYSLDLPTGRYTLQLRLDRGRYDYTHLGPGHGQVPPDTVVVDGVSTVPDINFILGGITLDLELPNHLDGEHGAVILHRWEQGALGSMGSMVDFGRGEINTGRLEVAVPGVLPGDYKIEVALACLSSSCWNSLEGERFWMPTSHNYEEAAVYTVGPDSVLALTDSILGEPALLEGRISGAWLEMGLQQEPRLAVVSEDSSQILREFQADSDGYFSAGFLVPGPVKLMVSQSGIDTWIGGRGFAEATVFFLQPGVTISGIDFAQCGLHLVMDESGLLLSSGDVLIFDRTDNFLVARLSDWSGSNLHTAIPNLQPGEYLVYLTPETWMRGLTDWIPQWFDRANTPDQAQPVMLTAGGEVARLDVVLELGGVISGRVAREGDARLIASVYIYPAAADTSWAQLYAWEEIYSLKGLPDGDYVVGALDHLAEPPSEEKYWYPGTYDREEAQVIEIRDASVVEDVDFLFPE